MGKFSRKIQSYTAIFKENRRLKVLFDAGPGMGKSSLGKKIGYDWSTGSFRRYTVVFFVALNRCKTR